MLIVAAVVIVAVVLAVVLTQGSGSSTSTTTSSTSATTASDPAVMELQRVMTRLGYYSGPIDGVCAHADRRGRPLTRGRANTGGGFFETAVGVASSLHTPAPAVDRHTRQDD